MLPSSYREKGGQKTFELLTSSSSLTQPHQPGHKCTKRQPGVHCCADKCSNEATNTSVHTLYSPMSASQSSGSVACLELPLRKPLEDDSVTPLVKWSTSISTSLLRQDMRRRTEKHSVRVKAHRKFRNSSSMNVAR